MSHVFQTFSNSQILLAEPGLELFADEAELLIDDVVQPLESTLDLAQPFLLLLLRHHDPYLLRSCSSGRGELTVVAAAVVVAAIVAVVVVVS